MKIFTLSGLVLFLLIICSLTGYIFPQDNQTGSLRGTITAADTKAALPYASVLIAGTNNGTAADIDGNFIIRNVVAGNRQIKVSYIGYETKTIDVVIKPDKTTKINVTLEESSILGKEVISTTQRMGQMEAINE